jgi:alkanesulfonate monooxygenase SsuD/methylene tetrahydromethanopterin reductase-like flavin-dependent oxidoreductase (luciferase family)
MFGFGRGGPVSGWGQRGTEWEATHAMMIEGIDLMMRCFREPGPFDHAGTYYRGKAIHVYPKPVQAPHPPISVATGNPILLKMAVERGFKLLTSQFARPTDVKRLVDALDKVAAERGLGGHDSHVTAVRGVFVADTDAKALSMVERDWQRHIDFNKKHFPVNYKDWKAPGEEDVTFGSLLDRGLMFIGSPATVADRIRTFYRESGGFGVFLMVTGRDWGTFDQRAQSMTLFAQDVVPRLGDLAPAQQAA